MLPPRVWRSTSRSMSAAVSCGLGSPGATSTRPVTPARRASPPSPGDDRRTAAGRALAAARRAVPARGARRDLRQNRLVRGAVQPRVPVAVQRNRKERHRGERAPNRRDALAPTGRRQRTSPGPPPLTSSSTNLAREGGNVPRSDSIKGQRHVVTLPQPVDQQRIAELAADACRVRLARQHRSGHHEQIDQRGDGRSPAVGRSCRKGYCQDASRTRRHLSVAAIGS